MIFYDSVRLESVNKMSKVPYIQDDSKNIIILKSYIEINTLPEPNGY